MRNTKYSVYTLEGDKHGSSGAFLLRCQAVPQRPQGLRLDLKENKDKNPGAEGGSRPPLTGTLDRKE